MKKPKRAAALPPIAMAAEDHERLTRLADAAQERSPELAEELYLELDRAKVVPGARLPESVVRMGSRVRYKTQDGEREVMLVYPGEADIEQGKISVMTPIGAALIGLSQGQAFRWTDRDGKVHDLSIVHVAQTAPHGTAHG